MQIKSCFLLGACAAIGFFGCLFLTVQDYSLLTSVIWTATSVLAGIMVASVALFVGTIDLVKRQRIAILRQNKHVSSEDVQKISNLYDDAATEIEHNAILSGAAIFLLLIATLWAHSDLPWVAWPAEWFITKLKFIHMLSIFLVLVVLVSVADTVASIFALQRAKIGSIQP